MTGDEVALRDHLLALMEADRTANNQRFDAQEKAVAAALASAALAVDAALTAAKEATMKAEADTQRWQVAANEWRGAMTDRERQFMPRTEWALAQAATDEKLEGFGTRLTTIEQRGVGGNEARSAIYAAVGFVISLLVLGGMLAAAGVFGK